MADRNIDIRIRANSNAAGEIDKTNRSLDNLDKSQGKAAKSAKASKEACVSAGQGFASVGQAASVAASGGLGPLSAALGGLSQQLPSLAAAAGPIGLVIAAFTAWKSAIDAVRTAAENVQKEITGIQLGNMQSGVRRLNESYKELTDQLSAASAELSRFYNAESAGADAVKRAELAKLELQAAEARAKLDPGDEFAARRLELDVARQKAAIEEAASARALKREQTAILQQTDLTRTEYGAAQAQQTALADKAAQIMAKIVQVNEQARAKADADEWGFRKKEIWAGANQTTAGYASELAKVRAEMAAAAKAQERAAGELATLASARDINRLNQSTAEITSAARRQGFSNQSADIYRSQQSIYSTQLEQAQTQQSGISSRLAELRAASVKEQGDVRRALNFGASEEQMRKEREEMRKAADAVRQYSAENAATMRELTRTINQAREALRNLPKN